MWIVDSKLCARRTFGDLKTVIFWGAFPGKTVRIILPAALLFTASLLLNGISQAQPVAPKPVLPGFVVKASFDGKTLKSNRVEASRSAIGQREKMPKSAAAKTSPVQIIVSLPKQRMSVYRDGKQIASTRISSGMVGFDTPTGIFSILQKRKEHYSNLYDNAPMPHMQRLTWSGIALHGGPVPNEPASHGCVRLPYNFARKLFSLTRYGSHVIVSRRDTKPVSISHENLFQPFGNANKTAASVIVANLATNATANDATDGMTDPAIRSPLRIFITRQTGREKLKNAQIMLKQLGYDPGEADGFNKAKTIGAIKAFKKTVDMIPIGTITGPMLDKLYALTGRKREANGHIYVRKNRVALFDAPINISDTKKPLGTHLFTAIGLDKATGQMRWNVVTVERPAFRKRFVRRLRGVKRPKPFKPAEITPTAALDRIVLTNSMRARISRFVEPGVSLVVSDNGMSSETGENTDFIVMTR